MRNFNPLQHACPGLEILPKPVSEVGIVSHAAKLKPEQAIEIIKLWRTEKYTQKDLAKMFSCSRGVISNITRGKLYTQAGGPIPYRKKPLRGEKRWKRTPEGTYVLREITCEYCKGQGYIVRSYPGVGQRTYQDCCRACGGVKKLRSRSEK